MQLFALMNIKIVKEKTNPAVDVPYDKILACVKRDLQISGNAFRLWVTLFTSTDSYTPTEPSLASQFKVSLRTMKYWIKELREYGYLTIIGSKANGYTWLVNKMSKGKVDVKTQGAKYCTLKNIKNNELKVQETTPIEMQNIAPIIKTMRNAPQGSVSIVNKRSVEIDTKNDINNDN
jgi:hypothetical protein